jgi:hypothetical protein
VVTVTKGKRHKGMILFGIILLLAGLLGGGAMVAKSMSNYEDAVKSMARAPVGCTTTLVFDKLGSFTLYIETKGKLTDIGGDCDANADYEHSGDKLPRVSLTLLDAGGDEVDLERGATGSYDVSGYKGSAVRKVQIDEAGTYRLNVESDDTDFAVSIGKNPKEDSDLLKTIGGAVALGGLILGLMFLLLGLRRRRPDAVPAAGVGAPPPGWPPSPYAPAAPTERHPGYRTEPPEPPVAPPSQPPLRLPDQPPGGGFAPPSFNPPPPPPPPPSPPPPPGWSVPEDDE